MPTLCNRVVIFLVHIICSQQKIDLVENKYIEHTFKNDQIWNLKIIRLANILRYFATLVRLLMYKILSFLVLIIFTINGLWGQLKEQNSTKFKRENLLVKRSNQDDYCLIL